MPKTGSQIFPGLLAPAIKPRSIQAAGLVVACTIAALAARWAIGFVDPDIPPFPTFLPAILLSAILAGAAAGILAATLGLAVSWFVFASSLPSAFTPASIALYVLASLAIIWITGQYRSLLRRLQESEEKSGREAALVMAENKMLAQIASTAPLSENLNYLAHTVEEYSGGEMLASVLLMDPDGLHLRHGAAPSLPAAYNQAIDGQPIGPAAGSCGTAAYRKEPVYVADINSDPLWANYRELASACGVKACWSIPILSRSKAVLGTFALYHREPRSPTDREKDIVHLLMRITTTAIERERNVQHRQFLVDELNHRVKNILAVVMSIAASTIRSQTDAAVYKTFERRLMALAKTQDLLSDNNWSSVEVRQLVTNVALEPFGGDRPRFLLDGPRTYIPARLILPFALAVHELCTNAAKYGALTTETGHVLINWGYGWNGERGQKFFLRWTEADGPPVNPPAHHGFGSRVIRDSFSSAVGSSATMDYRRDGLVCEISLPVDQLVSSPPD